MRYTAKKLALALSLVILVFSTNAYAKRGLGIINWGEELFEVENFQSEFSIMGKPQSLSIKIGYKCSHFGVFWADVFTWDCTMVQMMDSERYLNLPDSISNQLLGNPQYKLSRAKRSFWNHYAFWIFISMFSIWLYRLQVKFNAEVARIKKQEAFIRRQQRNSEGAAVSREKTN
ncbi:hypothetical protein [Polaromonas sp. A23]|uniref:hypothetical protein n=1 Tax=Polaromonas sp. A23 TaxID=1944133 RepID=UPI0009869166|nr:hypothetical protein [Polaromonas sp. A23]OOG43986.1 hypothetical protein B0B52_08760 [Polaromonas sp. A23]